MKHQNNTESNGQRTSPLEMTPEAFRALGYGLIDQIADFLGTLPDRPVTTGETPSEIRTLIGERRLPREGEDAERILAQTAKLLFDHSLFNGHPKFLGYITSSAAPIGALADLLAAAVNPNVGAWNLAPVASEIERQTISWIAEMIGYSNECGGILVSGGNMANFVGFLAARHAKAGWDTRKNGMRHEDGQQLRVYASKETHTWIHKATDLFGLGTDAIRWIGTDTSQRMDVSALRRQVQQDAQNGDRPFMVIGTAGSVSTGAIDPLHEIAEVCKRHELWFHVDGAYGAVAAVLPDAPADIRGMQLADSIALDPHKWLYAPLEAGCTLVRNPESLRDPFVYRPAYYKFDDIGGEAPINFADYGPQNSRGFRALKVWLGLRQVGRAGYEKMISDDIVLARRLYELAEMHPELQAFTHSLSITTLRYVPQHFDMGSPAADDDLNKLNTELLTRLQEGGEAFVSNAVIDGKYVLRACVVNFRTTIADIEALPEIIARIGRQVDAEWRK